MKLITTITEVYRKGKIYNHADFHNVPHEIYQDHFVEHDDPELEWCAVVKCIKPLKVVVKAYST